MKKEWCELTKKQQDDLIDQHVEAFKDEMWYLDHGFGQQESFPPILATWPESLESLITDY